MFKYEARRFFAGMHMQARLHRQGALDARGFAYIDKREWTRFLFYMDLVVIAVFMVSLVLMVVNAYDAGYQATRGASHTALWKVVTATGFMVGCLAYIFFRFFKNQYLAMTRTL